MKTILECLLSTALIFSPTLLAFAVGLALFRKTLFRQPDDTQEDLHRKSGRQPTEREKL